MVGGVAEYTFHLACALHKANVLNQVITQVPQTEIYDFQVIAPKKRNIKLRKLKSLLYLSERYLIKQYSLFKLKNNNDLVIINWLESPLAYDFIKNCQRFNINYGLILHGKEIITSSCRNSKYFNEICNQAKLLIFNSKATANFFKNTTLKSPLNSYILNPGINARSLNTLATLSITQLEERYSIDLQDKLIISTVSRLVKRKGIDLAIKAIAPLLKRNSNLVYLIGGNGEEYENLKQLINALQISNQAHLLGSISEHEKYSLLQYSSIFLMPNHSNKGTDFEGFGISFIEASYFKNVVIGGNSGGAVEAIAEGVSGFLIDTEHPKAINQIQKRLDYLINHPADRARLSESGRNYVMENFQTPNLVENFANYLIKTDF
jgi:glycosyltransferase involved in cell wall biosynthesis